jgi:signal peptidase I
VGAAWSPYPFSVTTGAGPRTRVLFWASAAVLACFAVFALVQFFTGVGDAWLPSSSMENTAMPGDRLIYVAGSIRRGDLVISRLREPGGSSTLLFKRLIGLPGDHVACCNSRGQVTVNGYALDESYVYPGDAPSSIRFSVTLLSGQAWLMGDHRSVSDDSRERGPTALSDILGRVTFIARGWHPTQVRTPRTFILDELAPPDSRPLLPLAWLFGAGLAVLALLTLLGTGLVLWVRRRTHRQLSASTA